MQGWVSTYRDILHIYFSPYYRQLSVSEFERVAPIKCARRFKIILKTLKIRVLQLFKADLSQAEKGLCAGKIWIYASSKNNLDCVRFIHDRFDESIFIIDKQREEFCGLRRVVLNLRFQAFYCCLFPVLWFSLVKMEGQYANRINNVVFRSLGFFEEWLRLLKACRPKAIIFSNDHNIESRSLLLAAKRLSIPTIYLQHASVSSSFPQLNFDLNLLEGEDSYIKYRSVGSIPGVVKIIGMPKFDKYLKFRKATPFVSKIGIPYNLNDDRRVVESVIRSIRHSHPHLQITVRRHPKDKSGFTFLSIFPWLKESDPGRETAFDFLIGQDCIIAGNSSIHLEATLLNIRSIYFNTSKDTFIDDYYGFVRNRLVPVALTIADMEKIISQPIEPELFRRAAYYNGVVGTNAEGKSEDLAIELIVDFLNSHGSVTSA